VSALKLCRVLGSRLIEGIYAWDGYAAVAIFPEQRLWVMEEARRLNCSVFDVVDAAANEYIRERMGAGEARACHSQAHQPSVHAGSGSPCFHHLLSRRSA
jgi:hypothetical protein